MKKYTLDGYQAITMLEALSSDQDPILLHDANYLELVARKKPKYPRLTVGLSVLSLLLK